MQTEGAPEAPTLPEIILTDEQRAKMAAVIAAMPKKSEGTTLSGSEDPDAVEREARKASTATGADVDWNEYTLDYNVAHLYPKAVFRETPQGPKWVAMCDEFMSTERSFRQHGKSVNMPGSSNGQNTEPFNVGEYLNEMVNSRDMWRVFSVLPASQGNVGVILFRQVPLILPDPHPIQRATEVEPPREQELKDVEDAAMKYAAEEGLTPEGSVGDDESTGPSEGAMGAEAPVEEA